MAYRINILESDLPITHLWPNKYQDSSQCWRCPLSSHLQTRCCHCPMLSHATGFHSFKNKVPIESAMFHFLEDRHDKYIHFAEFWTFNFRFSSSLQSLCSGSQGGNFEVCVPERSVHKVKLHLSFVELRSCQGNCNDHEIMKTWASESLN